MVSPAELHVGVAVFYLFRHRSHHLLPLPLMLYHPSFPLPVALISNATSQSLLCHHKFLPLNPSEVPVSQTGTRSIDSPWSPCECLQVWKPAFLRCTGNLSRRSLSHPLSCSPHRRCSRPDPLGSRVDTDKHREFVRRLCVSVSIQGTEANKFRPNYRWGQLERHGGEETEDVKSAQSIYNYLQSPPVPHKMHRLKWTWKTSG